MGKAAAQYVRDHLPRIIVEDTDFPLKLDKVVMRSFKEVDAAFAKSCTSRLTCPLGQLHLLQ